MILFIAIALSLVAIHQTRAQAVTPDGQFTRYVNQELRCATPIQERNGISEAACLDLCCENINCRSVVYRPGRSECELFSVVGTDTRTNKRRQGNNSSGSRSGRGGNRNRDINQARNRFRSQNAFQQSFQRSRWGNRRVKRQFFYRRGRGGGGGRYNGGGGGRYNGGGRGGGRQNQGGGRGSCGYLGAQIIDCPGSNYYVRTGTGNCGTVVTTPSPLPDGATCPSGEVARYIALQNTALTANDEVSFTATSPQQCIDACTNNQLPTGQPAPCLSVDFVTATSQCILAAEAAPPAGSGSVTTQQGTNYFEKICVPENLVTNCPDVFPQFPQKILVGFAQTVIQVDSIQECLDACLNSQNQFAVQCASGMYYFEENELNCILNAEDQTSFPDLFIDENQDRVTYFETGCRQNRALATSFGRAAGPIIEVGKSEWSSWSTCDRENEVRHRYRNCESANPNSCKKQTDSCENNAKEVVDTPCNALLKPDGTKDCEHKGRKLEDGKIVECDPEDC